MPQYGTFGTSPRFCKHLHQIGFRIRCAVRDVSRRYAFESAIRNYRVCRGTLDEKFVIDKEALKILIKDLIEAAMFPSSPEDPRSLPQVPGIPSDMSLARGSRAPPPRSETNSISAQAPLAMGWPRTRRTAGAANVC
jgi:hypothetical protein